MENDLNEFFDHTVSVDEVLSYYFESLISHPELYDNKAVLNGMASDEELEKDFAVFYDGWVSSTLDTNPSLDEIRPELFRQYRLQFGIQQKQ